MKLFGILLLALWISLESDAQFEAKNWVFNSHLLFQFSEDSLINIENKNITSGWTNFITQQSATCVSDSVGNLLFMATYHGIYDANCDSVPNGVLNGNIDLTQMVIVPRPMHPMNYYVLYPGTGADGKIRYSEVDMNLNNGMGAVIAGQDNVILNSFYNDLFYRITAVRHSNGRDVWVVSHRYNSNQYTSFLVTKDGIKSNPVISSVGLIIQEPAGGNNAWNSAVNGMIKISPDGRRIAWTSKGMHKIQIADFDTETGVVSNPVFISDEWPFYIDFSQDGNMLYVGSRGAVSVPNDTSHVTQINLIAGTNTQIINSAFRLDPYGPDYTGQSKVLQLGMDGKIYVGNASQPNGLTRHGVIESPSLPGISSNYNKYKYNLAPIGQYQIYDMPNFMVSYLDKNVFATTPCFGDTSMIYTLNRQLFDSIRWEINDPITGLHVFYNQDTIYHLFSQPGKYNVHCYRYQGQFVDDFIKKVQVLPYVQSSLQDTSICGGLPFQFSFGNSNLDVEWYYKSTYSTVFQLIDSGQTISVNQSGYYFPKVDYWSVCGNPIDTVFVDFVNINLNIAPDTLSGNCLGNYYSIIPSMNYSDVQYYIWNTGSFNIHFHPLISGLYTFFASGYGCEDEDSVFVIYDEPLQLNLGEDILTCNDSILLEAGINSGSFLWLPHNETTPQIVINQTDTFILQVTNGCGTYSDSIYIEILETPEIPNLPDTSVCEGDSILIQLPEFSAEYLWSTGDTVQNLTFSEDSYYAITVSNYCGTVSDGFNLTLDHELYLNLPDTLWLVAGDSILLASPASANYYYWSNGETSESIWVSDTGIVVLTAGNTCGEYVDSSLVIQTISIQSVESNEAFSNYPNPASTILYLRISSQAIFGSEFLMYSMDGKVILSGTIRDQLSEIDVNSLPKGIYFLAVSGEFTKIIVM